MQSILMLTSLMFVGLSTTDESPGQREIAVHVGIVGVDGTIDVPDEIDSPAEFVGALRGNQGVKWSEDFRLYASENTTAKCNAGSTLPVVSGYTTSPFGRRPSDQSGQLSSGGRGANAPPSTLRNPSGAMSNRSPIVHLEAIGTSIELKPKVLSNGKLLLDVKLESSRHEIPKHDPDPTNPLAATGTITRHWQIETSCAVKSGQAVLLRASESDITGDLPPQTVLVIITATVEN